MNSFSSFVSVLVVSVVFSGCASSPLVVSPPAAPVALQEATDGPRSPLTVTVQEVSRDAFGADIQLVVSKSSSAAPAMVSLELPAGVSATRFKSVVPAEFVGEKVIPVRLQWSALPASEVRVVAVMRGERMGATAAVPYRFGRAAPVAEVAETRALKLQVGELVLDGAGVLAMERVDVLHHSQVRGRRRWLHE